MKMQRIAIAIGIILAGCTVSQPRIKPSDTAAVSAEVRPDRDSRGGVAR